MAAYVDPREHPTKKQFTNFDLCIKCQGEQWTNTINKGKVNESLTCPKPESYVKFLDTVDLRAKYENQEFIH